jgi:hypothetical protein
MDCKEHVPTSLPVRKCPRVGLLSLLSFTASLSSCIAWKVTDVDFAAKLGSDMLCEAYVFMAVALFASSSLILLGMRWISPQAIFLNVQRYAGIFFGLLACCEAVFSISQYNSVIFFLKVAGYVYSALVLNSFWIAVGYGDEKSGLTLKQSTLYCFSTYLGMAAAGVWLQSDTIRAGQLGLLVVCCSIVCQMLAKLSFRIDDSAVLSAQSPVADKPRSSPVQTLFHAVKSSRAVMALVIGSILLNVLVSSTEYYFIADFESRYLLLNNAPRAVQSIGSFVLLIGLGNILSLGTSNILTRFRIGRAGLPFAAILSALMIRVGFTNSHSLLSSVLTLLVVESLYPLVVESNMQYLLDRFPEAERLAARTMIDTVAEPAGYILSAVLLFLPWFDIYALGIGVVCVSFLLILCSCSLDSAWRKMQLSMFKQGITCFAARCSTFLVVGQTLLTGADVSYDFVEDTGVFEGYNWLHIPAVYWCD